MAKKSKMKLPINEVLGVVAGAVAAGFVSKLINDKLPNLQPQLKSLIPIAAGVLLAGNKNAIVKGAGYGMVAKGGADLAESLMPGSISGVDDIFLSEPADQSILSAPADQSILSGHYDEQGNFIGEDMNGEFDMNGEDMNGEFDMNGEDMNGEFDMNGEEMALMGMNEE
jgi:hypothetical protein